MIPLSKLPVRQVSPEAPTICRFHNYHRDGCKKHLDPQTHCPLDHDHCHNCLEPGHIALECPHSDSMTTVSPKFASTKPNRPIAKTVLGDELLWMAQLGYPSHEGHEWQEGDEQLWRCRKQKRWEASLLLALPANSSYVDVGAHFGDSVVTMAAHAQAKGRTDLRFFAFEPSAWKCRWIEKVSKANGLNITVTHAAVGDQEQWVQPELNRNGTPKQRSLFNGSLRYEPTTDITGIPMTTLDHYKDVISPMGILHIDVEGMEPQALKGAFSLLSMSARPSCIVAEAWDDDDCRKRGLEADAAGRIQAVINVYNASVEVDKGFVRGPDMVDRERNLFYSKV